MESVRLVKTGRQPPAKCRGGRHHGQPRGRPHHQPIGRQIWNARSLNCLQTFVDKVPHRPENIISAMFFDSVNRQLVTGSSKLEVWPLHQHLKRGNMRSHDAPIVAAILNENFHQVCHRTVSGCENSTVSVWDLATGEKAFQYRNAHDKLEITAMCFDGSGRRLITGSRDGEIKMWNFNTGMILKKMIKQNNAEVSDVCYVEMGLNRYVVAVGWDQKVHIFLDDPDCFEDHPYRVLTGDRFGAHKGWENRVDPAVDWEETRRLGLTSIFLLLPNLLALQ
ncbi:MAG: WD40-repeat-containing domain protein [Olpidium bornovanus]|uniref:WD40-repeat-containing domain protein n=1 Tax=Olpidium bornovanus TaxID=278681 RepID=A0A8H8A174_9FUNG|nr:MAG: WD40-repeat-containing domain protein [Olpidium bornovanus]